MTNTGHIENAKKQSKWNKCGFRNNKNPNEWESVEHGSQADPNTNNNRNHISKDETDRIDIRSYHLSPGRLREYELSHNIAVEDA